MSPVLRADRVEAPASQWRVNGTVDYVADADVADLVVASAAAAGRTLVFLVDPHTEGVSLAPLDMAGGHRAFAVRFDDVAIGDDAVLDAVAAGVIPTALRRLANTAVALGSLDLVGVGQAVLDRTVDYTKLRHQFGRSIASFQAAQHVVANMHIALAAARLAAHAAVFCREPGDGRRAHACGHRCPADHARRAPAARRHGLCHRDRPASVERTGPARFDAGRRRRCRRIVARTNLGGDR